MNTIRFAVPDDIPFIRLCIHELAEYEQAAEQDHTTEELLRRHLFDEPSAKVLIAEADGVPAGIALWFNNFSTWLARPGIYLEDLYVRAPYRHRGLGKALLRRLAQLAIENDWGRVEWSCLKWNTPSLDFYRALGAQTMDEWTALRLDGQHLQDFGQPTPATPK